MDGREGLAIPSFYLQRGAIGGSGGPGPGLNVHGAGAGAGAGRSAAAPPSVIHTPPGFNTLSNPNIPVHSSGPSTFHVEDPSPNFPHGMSSAIVSGASQRTEPVKKKRGRPRKYGPDGSNVALGLSPMPPSKSKPSTAVVTSGEKARRGRPPGTGWKQKLAPLGEWMNASAGVAFAPHVLHIQLGEDVAAKILAFAQQRPRALCVMSGNGSVSAVTLHLPSVSGSAITYEGRFEILCLSGSYLVAENGGPRNRTGGISISVCSPDGHIIGGAVGGKLIAASPVHVVACSFVYGGTKGKTKAGSEDKDEKYLLEQSVQKSLSPGASQSYTPNSGGPWPPVSRHDAQTDIDLTSG